jgi:hypothetical protein
MTLPLTASNCIDNKPNVAIGVLSQRTRRASAPNRDIGLLTTSAADAGLEEHIMNIALAEPNSGLRSILSSFVCSFQPWCNRFLLRSQRVRPLHAAAAPAIYQIADRLHEKRTVRVAGDAIATTVSAWLAELGALAPWRKISHERCAAAIGLLSMPLASTCPLT